jgi:hypothetical protein
MKRQSTGNGGWDEGMPFEDADDDAATIPCPYCRREIHEQSQRCPYCEQYISEEDAPPTRKAGWLIAGAVLGLIVVIYWILTFKRGGHW